MKHNTKVSGELKINRWIDLRNQIDKNPKDNSLWEKAYDDFLYDRIKSRYLNPIEVVHEKFKYQGEGFAIVTIQCSLIEFLETTMTGETYMRRKPDSKKFQYNESRKRFISFLTDRFPFSKIFDKSIAQEFYEDVRCGLLHEAQTKNNWLIRVDNKKEVIEIRKDGMLVFDRVRFQSFLYIFLKRYKKDLINDDQLKEALRRKINQTCRLPTTD